MTAPRLRPDIWVKAVLRLCATRDLPAFVVHRGDPDAGAVLLKLNRLEHGAVVLSQTRDIDGAMRWIRASGGDGSVPDADAEAIVQRHIQRDPDLWVIEIEDRQGRHPIDDWPMPPER
jgi:hypothetical protein